MSTDQPQGYGQSGDPQNPYGQPNFGKSSDQNPYGQPQNPYGQPYPQQQPPYAPPPQQPQYQLPPWLAQPAPYGGPPVPGSRALASAGDRLLARLIDAAVLLVPFIVLYAVVASVNVFLYYVVSALMVVGYEAAMTLTQNGQTVGKKAMKLRVVALEHGGRPADNAFWARAGVYGGPQAVYCLGGLFSLLNVLWQLWDKPLQQCLHDKAAKTVVVKES